MKLGVIGTGNMGSTLIQGVYSVCSDVDIFAFNRSNNKLLALKMEYEQLNICHQMEMVVEKSDLLVLAVPYSAISAFPISLVKCLNERRTLTIVLSGYVPMKLLEKCIPSKVTKAYPNVNWAVGSGVTIVNFGTRLTVSDKETILEFFSKLGFACEVTEGQLRPFANLMSCGPALWISLISLFVEANVTKYAIAYGLGLEMAQKTIEGTLQLMKQKHLDARGVIDKVAGPGGVTEVGLKLFQELIPGVFSRVIETMDSRDKQRIKSLAP